jgi:hypothetical protein
MGVEDGVSAVMAAMDQHRDVLGVQWYGCAALARGQAAYRATRTHLRHTPTPCHRGSHRWTPAAAPRGKSRACGSAFTATHAW